MKTTTGRMSTSTMEVNEKIEKNVEKCLFIVIKRKRKIFHSFLIMTWQIFHLSSKDKKERKESDGKQIFLDNVFHQIKNKGINRSRNFSIENFMPTASDRCFLFTKRKAMRMCE